MHERSSNPRRLRDINQEAGSSVDAVVGGGPEPDKAAALEKNPHAAALGRLGGLKGGPARAMKLSAARRSEIARRAADARWHGEREPAEGA